MSAKAITVLLLAALATTAAAQPKTPLFGKRKPKPVAAAPAPTPVAASPAPASTVPPVAPQLPAPAPAPVPPPVADSRPAAPPAIEHLRAAYAFALPVYEMMRTRYLQVSKAESLGAPGVNRLYARTTLADATSRDVTTPNNDTLYSSAWLDLAGGPVVLNAPAIPGRYHSAALMSLFTDNVAVIGTRTGGTGGRYLIVGPAWATQEVPRGTTVIRSPTNDAWLLVRVVVNGPDDLAAAAGLIRGFTIEVPADHIAPVPITAVPTPDPKAVTFRAVVNEAIGRSPLPARARAFADVGILPLTPENAGSAPDLPPEVAARWAAALPKLRAELKGGLAGAGTEVDGWSYPGPGIGNFGDDDVARARVALGGLGALPRVEAIYLTASVDRDGAALSGAQAYTARIPAKLPVGAFWSLTMYRQEADGRLFFVDTPSKRFAVGDRSDLRANRDGSFDIFVQAGEPQGERAVNWLPAPKGPFKLVFRAYLPKPEFLDGSFKLPPVEFSEVVP